MIHVIAALMKTLKICLEDCAACCMRTSLAKNSEARLRKYRKMLPTFIHDAVPVSERSWKRTLVLLRESASALSLVTLLEELSSAGRPVCMASRLICQYLDLMCRRCALCKPLPAVLKAGKR